MYVVGLTGGIGSGKSTVAERFAARGVPVIDADVIARELVEPGQPGLAAIVAAFGTQVLTEQGRLDRARLRERVFADPVARRRLEAILHPAVRRRIEAQIETLDAAYCLVVVPLLFEADQADLADRILVIDTSPQMQIARVAKREGLDRAAVEAIMAAQLPRAERLRRAHDVLLNDGDLDRLDDGVAQLHARYERLAQEQARHSVPSGAGLDEGLP
jgi:dephospho-CoA kinase